MNVHFLSFLYIINLTTQLLAIKGLKINYSINSELFITTSYSLLFPLFLIYFLYNKIKYDKFKYDKFGLLCGLLDFIQLFLSIISIQNLTMGEYLTFRTCAIFFTSLFTYFGLKKEINLLKKIGIGFILLSCIILLSFSGLNNFLYSIICLFSSFLYSLMGFIIEKNVTNDQERNSNFVWTKLISNGLNLLIGIIFEFNNQTITNNFNHNLNTYLLVLIMIYLSISENGFYYNKLLLINKFDSKDSGSFYTGILDIIRRIITFIISLIIFSESYTAYIYVSYSFMLLGCILSIINKKVNYIKFDDQNNITNKENKINQESQV